MSGGPDRTGTTLDPGITGPEKLRLDAAVEVPDVCVGFGEVEGSGVPGGKYACGRFKGTNEQVGDAWAWLLRDWLPASGMQLDSRPFFEYYPVDAAFNPATGQFESDICIPVTSL